MENWAYIYILNEETEQQQKIAKAKRGLSGEVLAASDRAAQTTATPPAKSSSCDSDYNREFAAAYPSYFFL